MARQKLNKRVCIIIEELRDSGKMNVDQFDRFLDDAGLKHEDVVMIELGLQDVPLRAAEILHTHYDISWNEIWGTPARASS